MSRGLLSAKLSPPRVPSGFVPRPRLCERLDAGLPRRLTLISAPAGYGKSTLLSSWLAGLGTGIGVAWLTLDEQDNDPARFLAYLIGALQRLNPAIADGVLTERQSFQPPALEEMLAVLIDRLDEDGTGTGLPVRLLVLDDYHLITLRAIHEGLSFFLAHLPKALHLVISSRSDPPLPLARLRGRGELAELRAEDLRFTEEEARCFITEFPELNLSPDDAKALSIKTEGWIAGLQLAAISLRGREDTAGFIKEFAGTSRYILDYLTEEVLRRRPAQVQDFLLRTSVLSRINGPLCDAILGEDFRHRYGVTAGSSVGSREILADLERDNLFLIPLDECREWYRYHHLFADLLRQRLLHTVGGEGVASLHQRAAAWCEMNGQANEAIEYALAAKDYDHAARLMERELPMIMWGRGELTTIARWIKALPGKYLQDRVPLGIHYAFILLLAGQQEAAARLLESAEDTRAMEPASAQTTRETSGMVSVVRAYLARFRGDVEAVSRYSHQALDLLPAENALWRSSGALIAGDAHSMCGETATAGPAYAEVLKLSLAANNEYLTLLASLKLATNEWLQGRLHRAVDACRDGLRYSEEAGLAGSPTAGGLHGVWGEVLREWNDLENALTHAEKGMELCRRIGNVAVQGWSYLVLARVLLSKGDPAGAEDAVTRLAGLVRETDLAVWLVEAVPILRAGLSLLRGNAEAAERQLRDSAPVNGAKTGYQQEGRNIMLARVLVARGKMDEARVLLEILRRETEAGGRLGRTIEILIMQALAFQGEDAEKGLAVLERALLLAEPEGYHRVFLEAAGPDTAGLLRRLTARGRATSYIGKLLPVFGRPSQTLRHEALVPDDSLSGRELEVLRLLAAGLSKPEIARELIVAESTVRSHVKSIFGKLNAHRRREAVQRAREMGLIT